MTKATAPDDTKLVEGLLKALDGQPMRQTGGGRAPGIFPASQTGRNLIKRAIELGYLEECPEPLRPPPNRRGARPPKPVPHARITPKGREWVLQQISPRQALEGLLAAFHKQSDMLRSEESEVGVLQAQLAGLKHSFEQVQRTIQDVTARRREDESRILTTIQSVAVTLERLTAPDSTTRIRNDPASSGKDLGADIESFVRKWQQDRGADCPLPELYKHLKEQYPDLTIGTFHDLLRSLHDRDRVRLTGWAGSLDRLPEPNLAMFISSKVMYYLWFAHVRGRFSESACDVFIQIRWQIPEFEQAFLHLR